MNELIYIHRGRKAAYADAAAAAEYSFPDFVAGETRGFSFRFLREAAGAIYQEFPNLKSLTAAIGLVDARPTAGSIAYQFGSGASTAANTTPDLPFNHNAVALQAAINGVAQLVTAYGTAMVQEVPGGHTIFFSAAVAAIPITARRNVLAPLTVVRSWAYQLDATWVHEVRLVQAPLEITSAFELVLPPAPTITPVQDGGMDSSGTFLYPEIQRLNMPPEFLGSYQIRRPDNLARTVLLDRADDPETVVAEAIQAIYADKGISVQLFENYALITWGGAMNGMPQPLLSIVVGDAPPGDPTISMDLLRPAVYAALRAQESVAAFLELRAYIAEDGALPGDPGLPEVLFRREIRLVRDQNFDALASVADPKWMRAPNPVDYIPYTDSQAAVGTATWQNAIGNAVPTFVINHNFSTEAIASLVIRENITGGRVLEEGAGKDYTWVTLDANSIELTFAATHAPASLYAVLMAGIEVTAWLPHTHTIEQIVGLSALLDNLTTRVTVLEGVLPSTGLPAPATVASGISIDLPATKEILFFKGTTAEMAGMFGEKIAENLTPPKATRAPLMIAAAHDAVVDSYTGGALPALAVDSVWQNNSAAVVDMGRGIYGGKVAVSGYFASDGRARYAVERQGATTSFFPTGFTRELWRIFVNDKMLRVNRTLSVQFGLAVQAVLATSNAQWLLVIEKGTAPQQATPATTGTNLENVVWDAAPILSQRLIVTPARQTHSFGARIKRELVALVDTLKLDTFLYGVWEGNDAAAPASANFALRARLIQFDTENARSADARGWVAYEQLDINPATGEPVGGSPKAIIT